MTILSSIEIQMMLCCITFFWYSLASSCRR